MIEKIKNTLKKFDQDQDGASMIEYVLIIAAIALPLLAVLIIFWKDIREWIDEQWGEIRDDS